MSCQHLPLAEPSRWPGTGCPARDEGCSLWRDQPPRWGMNWLEGMCKWTGSSTGTASCLSTKHFRVKCPVPYVVTSQEVACPNHAAGKGQVKAGSWRVDVGLSPGSCCSLHPDASGLGLSWPRGLAIHRVHGLLHACQMGTLAALLPDASWGHLPELSFRLRYINHSL